MINAEEHSDGSFPFTPHFTRAPGFRMHYVDEGEGAPIVCLHGEPTWAYLYRAFIPALSRHHRVVVPDHMGFGKSETPADREYTLATHVDNLEALILELGLEEITLVLQDWGGPIGEGFALRHPERVRRLCLLNTVVPLRLPIEQEIFPKNAESEWFRWIRAASEDGSLQQVLGNLGVTVLSVMKRLGFENSAAVDDTWIRAYSAHFRTRADCEGAINFPLDFVTSATAGHHTDYTASIFSKTTCETKAASPNHDAQDVPPGGADQASDETVHVRGAPDAELPNPRGPRPTCSSCRKRRPNARVRSPPIQYRPGGSIPETASVAIVIANPATSTTTGWPVGFWWSELTHTHWALADVGYEIEVFSPRGGVCQPDALSDPPDPSGYSAHDLITRGFIATPHLAALVETTRPVAEIDVRRFDAILVVGGQSPMFSFDTAVELHRAFLDFYEQGKLAVALCHGVAILRYAVLSNGEYLVKGRTVTGFANVEEDFADNAAWTMNLLPRDRSIMPWRGWTSRCGWWKRTSV